MAAKSKSNSTKGEAPGTSGMKDPASADTRQAAVPSASGAAAQPAKDRDQLASFEAAVHLFNARKYEEARELFRAALAGPHLGISHKSELHIRMCNQRLEKPAVVLNSPEEHYDYAVALINSRDLAAAQHHLEQALALDSGADHVYYALALCRGLSGDLQGAYDNLKRAIDLQPRNRIAARQDADFAALANQPPLDRLLYPEKKGAA